MTLRDIMKYIESEFDVINLTPCEVCGGEYIAEDSSVSLLDDVPYDICDCVCSDCGHEKTFEFSAPFLQDKKSINIKKSMN